MILAGSTSIQLAPPVVVRRTCPLTVPNAYVLHVGSDSANAIPLIPATPDGPLAAQDGVAVLKKLLVRHSCAFPVRNTSSFREHFRTDAVKLTTASLIPAVAATNDRPPSVVRLICPKSEATIQSVSG